MNLTKPTGDLARDVLRQAAVEGIYLHAVPAHQAAQIAAADQIVAAAITAWRAGVRGPEVVALLAVAYGHMKPTTAPATFADVRGCEKAVARTMGGR